MADPKTEAFSGNAITLLEDGGVSERTFEGRVETTKRRPLCEHWIMENGKSHGTIRWPAGFWAVQVINDR